jgi:hypothetical protein
VPASALLSAAAEGTPLKKLNLRQKLRLKLGLISSPVAVGLTSSPAADRGPHSGPHASPHAPESGNAAGVGLSPAAASTAATSTAAATKSVVGEMIRFFSPSRPGVLKLSNP